jgi:hypothetical protein
MACLVEVRLETEGTVGSLNAKTAKSAKGEESGEDWRPSSLAARDENVRIEVSA